MAIYHNEIKIIGRTGGRSIISASAYRNASKMHDNETGLNYDFTRKRNVVDSVILYCDNAPDEWKIVPDEAIEEFKKTRKYKKAPNKDAAVEWFRVRYRKERLWNEVIKVENYADAQLAREFELAIPYEFSMELGRQAVIEYVQKYMVDDGMCADIVWHDPDKKIRNPHAHVLVTMRPIKANGQWAPKETKEYALDENGNKIPVINPETGLQKIGDRNRKVWKRVTVQKNYWNSDEKFLEWREGWTVVCNQYLSPDKHIDHRSNEERGINKTATVHEGYAARKLEEQGQTSWVCELNREIKHANSETKIVEIRTEYKSNKFEKLKSELEGEDYDTLRREARRIDMPAGRKSIDEEIIESGRGTTANDNSINGQIERRENLRQCEREIEQRERETAVLAQAAARANVDSAESIRPDGRIGGVEESRAGAEPRKRRTGARKRASGDAVAGTRSRIHEFEEGLPGAARSITSRTRGVFESRIREYTQKFGEYIEEIILRIRNRINKKKGGK